MIIPAPHSPERNSLLDSRFLNRINQGSGLLLVLTLVGMGILFIFGQKGWELAIMLGLLSIQMAAFFIQKKAQSSLKKRIQDMEANLQQTEKLALLGHITAGVAHEINNPINFISANVSPLQRNLDDLIEIIHAYQAIEPIGDAATELKEAHEKAVAIELEMIESETSALLEGIQEGSQRTQEIVKGIRSYLHGELQPPGEFEFHPCIESSLLLLKGKWDSKIEIVRIYSDSDPVIMGYAGPIKQVIMNLLDNAIDAMGDHGTISLTTKTIENRLKFIVQDSGEGIPSDIQSMIFHPFFTTKSARSGTGLGLYISKDIVKRHGGTIEVQSDLGKGTTFVVELPLN